MKNYYEKLEVAQSVTIEEIKKSYRQLSKKYHPDMHVGGNKHAEDVFKEIKEAYEVLSNPSKKAYYDYQLELVKQQVRVQDNTGFAASTYQTTSSTKGNTQYKNSRNRRTNVTIDNSKRGTNGILPVFIGGLLLIGGLIWGIYAAEQRRRRIRESLPDYKVKEAMRKYDHVMKYDYVDYFREGRTWVLSKGKYGMIDLQGNQVTKNIYDWAQQFHDGIAVVKRHGKYGFINNQGIEITPFKYDFVEHFVEGRALVMRNHHYSFIDKQGKEIIQLDYDEVGKFRNGLANFSLDGKWGFIDIHGNEVIKATYEKVYPFSQGLSAVRSYSNYKWGFINRQGKVVIPFKYDYVNSFDQTGITDVVLKNVNQTIDTKGKCLKGCY